jgi:hypothetical protein
MMRRCDGVLSPGGSEKEAFERSDEPLSVLAAVAHYRRDGAPPDDDRSAYLLRCVTGLIEIDATSTVVVVITNDPTTTAEVLRVGLSSQAEPISIRVESSVRRLRIDSCSGREVVVARWSPGLIRRHGVYLTWAHLPVLKAAHRSGRFSHLIYLEDDMHLTERHLRYWCSFREPMWGLGLIPGFVRYELFGGEIFLTDQVKPRPPEQERQSLVNGEPTGWDSVVPLSNPYQAFYILDRQLAAAHFRHSVMRSSLRSRVIRWDVRARAAAGPIFDDVPPGHLARNPVPVAHDGQHQALHPDCLIEHLPATYAQRPEHILGSLRVGDLFLHSD